MHCPPALCYQDEWGHCSVTSVPVARATTTREVTIPILNRVQGAEALRDRSMDPALLLTAPQLNHRVVCSWFDAENSQKARIMRVRPGRRS